MITGTYVNTFALNGSVLSHQPTTHGWDDRDSLGIDGNGNSIYVSPRQYKLNWDFLDTEEFNEIYAYFLAQGVTGSITSRLPKWRTTPYTFFDYSGTILREPTYENWFENYYTNVRLIITRITTT